MKKQIIIMMCLLFPFISFSQKAYLKTETPINDWIDYTLVGPDRFQSNNENIFTLEMLPKNYLTWAHRYKWNPASWTVGKPDINITFLLPKENPGSVELLNFMGREVIHRQNTPGDMRIFTGPKSTGWTNILVDQTLGKALETASQTLGSIFICVSAAPAIGNSSDKREAL